LQAARAEQAEACSKAGTKKNYHEQNWRTRACRLPPTVKGYHHRIPGAYLSSAWAGDGYSRVAWVEVLEDKKALTVMFAMLKALNILKRQYNLEVDAVLTDNGAEFGSGPATKNKKEHPFERLLLEMSIRHRYTGPYRPQTNGKVERFRRTLNEDFIEGALYENLDDLRNELLGFLVYYNEHRPHSAIGNITPIKMLNM
jgi:transposase InsO family protein